MARSFLLLCVCPVAERCSSETGLQALPSSQLSRGRGRMLTGTTHPVYRVRPGFRRQTQLFGMDLSACPVYPVPWNLLGRLDQLEGAPRIPSSLSSAPGLQACAATLGFGLGCRGPEPCLCQCLCAERFPCPELSQLPSPPPSLGAEESNHQTVNFLTLK